MSPSPFQRHMDAIAFSKAPLPLTRKEAAEQAYRLKMLGLSYESISVVMRMYHGESWTSGTWRKWCRALGAPPTPRGPGSWRSKP